MGWGMYDLNKVIIFLIIFIIFGLNVLCFSAPPKKVSRQKALQLIATVMQTWPRMNYLFPQECTNCNNYTQERDFYYVSSDGTFENSVIFFYGFCKKCNYLEVGYRGDDEKNYGGFLYQGTK